MKTNKMNLKVGKYILNESVSKNLYNVMRLWQKKYFGKEITFKDCQKILIEYEYVLYWSIETWEEEHTQEVFFSVTVENQSILNNQLKGMGYYSFDLLDIEDAIPIDDDRIWVKKILEDHILESP